jgi:hypothetical protein
MSYEMAILLRHSHGIRKTTMWMLGVARGWSYINTEWYRL